MLFPESEKLKHEPRKFFSKEMIIEYMIFAIGAIATSWLYGEFMTWLEVFPFN